MTNKAEKKNLKRTTENYNLEQLIEQPTEQQQSQTRIDLLFTHTNPIELQRHIIF